MCYLEPMLRIAPSSQFHGDVERQAAKDFKDEDWGYSR